MDKGPNIENKKLELLKQLAEGHISAHNYQLLERYALDDDFVFEALEGYHLHKSTDHKTSLANLSDKIKNKGGAGAKVRTLPRKGWMVAAASLALLLAITFVVRMNLDNDQDILANNSDAKSEVISEESKAPTAGDANGIIASSEILQDTIESEPLAAVRSEPKEESLKKVSAASQKARTETYVPAPGTPRENPQKQTTTTIANTKPVEIPAGEAGTSSRPARSLAGVTSGVNSDNSPPDIAALPQRAEDPIEYTKEQIEEAIDNKDKDISVRGSRSEATDYYVDGVKVQGKKAKAADRRKQKNQREMESDAIESRRVISSFGGVVSDESGNGIIAANVIVEGTDISATTDIDGEFKLDNVPLPAVLVVTYLGYEEETVEVVELVKTIEIVLKESSVQLDEVAVVSKNYARVKATPRMGFDGFADFIKANKELSTSNSKGTVTLLFTVDKDGSLKDFKVLDSFGPEYEAEAIRLMQAGGKWTTKPKGTEIETQYTVKFY